MPWIGIALAFASLLLNLDEPSGGQPVSSYASSPAGPEPLTRALAQQAQPGCEAQRFHKSIPSCCGLETFFWDGKRCVDVTMTRCGCMCSGPDCGNLYDTLQSCQRAHAHCVP